MAPDPERLNPSIPCQNRSSHIGNRRPAPEGHHHLRSLPQQAEPARRRCPRRRLQHVEALLQPGLLLVHPRLPRVPHRRLGEPEVSETARPDGLWSETTGTDSWCRNEYLNSKAGRAEFADEE